MALPPRVVAKFDASATTTRGTRSSLAPASKRILDIADGHDALRLFLFRIFLRARTLLLFSALLLLRARPAAGDSPVYSRSFLFRNFSSDTVAAGASLVMSSAPCDFSAAVPFVPPNKRTGSSASIRPGQKSRENIESFSGMRSRPRALRPGLSPGATRPTRAKCQGRKFAQSFRVQVKLPSYSRLFTENTGNVYN